jgi:hypothetical protein
MNPIEAAIGPLKSQAMERAEKDAKALIERVLTDLEKNGWNLDLAAPRPNSRMSRIEYKTKASINNLYALITASDWVTRRMNEPDMRKRSEKNEVKFVQNAVELAAAQYDAFVRKLVSKIGPCDNAILTGSHVWGYSILTVNKGLLTERWQTQQIVNQSKLGTIFNQWPSRKLRA